MNQEFQTLFNYAKQLRSCYLRTLAASKIFDRFNELLAPNKVGKKKAEKNVKIFSKFKYFFLTTKEAARCYFLIELAKFFDTHKKSLTVYKVIQYAEKNISKLTKQDFLDYHRGRQILPELFADYKQLSKSDLTKIKKRLGRNKQIINKLIAYRNKHLAHNDVEKIKVKITVRETRALLDIVKDVIGLLYSKLDFSVNTCINFEREPVVEMDRLIEGLIEHEQHRLKEIRKKYKI